MGSKHDLMLDTSSIMLYPCKGGMLCMGNHEVCCKVFQGAGNVAGDRVIITCGVSIVQC